MPVDERVVCTECGADNRAEARFCRNCGSALPAPETPASGPQPARTLSSLPPQGDAALAPAPGWRWLAWPAGAAALVAIPVLAGWQLHWPAAVFGPQKAPSSVRPVAGASPSPASAAGATGSITSATASSSPPVVSSGPTAVATPRASRAITTLEAYIAATNAGAYGRAGQIVGRDTGTTYASFVSGFKGTEKDTLTILSARGDVVTVRLSALHTNGVVQVFEGTYTVRDGAIVSTDVQQVS